MFRGATKNPSGKTSTFIHHPLMEALLPMQCLVHLLKMSPLATGFLKMLLNVHFTCYDIEENAHQINEYFLDCLERKDTRVYGLWCSLHLLTAFDPQHHQTAQVIPNDKFLKSTYDLHCLWGCEPWNRLPKEDVHASFLEVFQARFVEGVPACAGDLELDVL